MRRISSLNRVIDQISFPRLQQLAISTGMVCIEGIHRMNLPKLQKLWLGTNYIVIEGIIVSFLAEILKKLIGPIYNSFIWVLKC